MTLSVVVTIVEGGRSLERCLIALSEQTDPPALEVLVPYDDTVAGIDLLEERFPAVRFPALGSVRTTSPPTSPRGQHELYDRRRALGLSAAAGDVVAILEDRGVPAPDWARSVVRLHSEYSHAVIGGAVENGIDRLVNWAVFFCDFGRYQRPFVAGPAAWVTDVNVSYKRRALDSTIDLWRDRYHEPIVHEALLSRGETLFLTPEPVVAQMRTLTGWTDLLRERRDWGRLFAYTRIGSHGGAKRLAYLVASPLIPIVMFARQARLQTRKGHLNRFLPASPAVALLLLAWGIGEAIGYFTGKP